MHLARVAVLALLTGALAVGGTPAIADPGVSTNASGYVENGRPTAAASYRQTTESIESVEADWPAARPVADGGSPGRATECYSHLAAVIDGVRQYATLCPGDGGGWAPIALIDPASGAVTGTVSGSGPAVDAATLAEFAMTELALPTPAVRMNPDGEQVVQLPSWLWIDAGQWRPRQATAAAGPVTSTVTADPVRVVWDMGTGDQVACDGPGRPYRERFAETPEATDCTYTYERSSAGEPDAAFDVTATIEWAVSWAGSDGTGGDLGVVTSSSTSSVRVAELQALVQ